MFTLKINLGSDAMQDNLDVAGALENVVREIYDGRMFGIIRDINGNLVGTWSTDD